MEDLISDINCTKMKNLLSFLFFVAVVVTNSCQTETIFIKPKAPILPPKTQSGENTFGCFVNGKMFIPRGGWLGSEFSNHCQDNFFSLSISDDKNTEAVSIQLAFAPIYDTSVTISNYDSTNNKFMIFSVSYDYYRQHAYPINQYTGHMSITKRDTINHIISGTFWFDAIDTTNNKVIQVRDGRFDLKTGY
jgi:hypothetical protein